MPVEMQQYLRHEIERVNIIKNGLESKGVLFRWANKKEIMYQPFYFRDIPFQNVVEPCDAYALYSEGYIQKNPMQMERAPQSWVSTVWNLQYWHYQTSCESYLMRSPKCVLL